MDKIDPNAPIVTVPGVISGVRLDEATANEPGLDLASVLVVDHRILMADSDPASEITRQMGEALAELTTAEWIMLGMVMEENAA